MKEDAAFLHYQLPYKMLMGTRTLFYCDGRCRYLFFGFSLSTRFYVLFALCLQPQDKGLEQYLLEGRDRA
jgi:hypothetical protein